MAVILRYFAELDSIRDGFIRHSDRTVCDKNIVQMKLFSATLGFVATFLEITEKECVKTGTPTRKRKFNLCNFARPSQQKLSSCLSILMNG